MKTKAQKTSRNKRNSMAAYSIIGFAMVIFAFTAPSTIEDVFFPGSQDSESGTFDSPDRCRSCHGDYDMEVEPFFNWSGSMMAQAARDPLYEACLTISNQDVPNAGDLCIRCHSPEGWLGGRSIPTDGSALTNDDMEGIHCDFCHRLVKPTNPGTNPFPLDQDYTENTWPADNIYLGSIDSLPPMSGNGMYIVDSDGTQRGPFVDAGPKHAFHYSPFHSESALCGTCHDVSNPVYDRQADGSYTPNAFGYSAPSYNTYDLFPVERTYSEWLMSAYNTPSGVYAPQFGGNKVNVSTCQDCHMKDISGVAANKSSALYRDDLPHHDMTGGNTFIPGIIAELYPSDVNAEALDSAVARARTMLQLAATMDLTLTDNGDHFSATVRVTNETGHKLPSGYPEGRRIWINIVAKDNSGSVIYESAHYDYSTGTLTQDGDAKIYEIKPGLDNLMSGITELPEGPSFHFVLNNAIFSDNRIPPRGFTNAAFEAIQSPPVDYIYADGQYWDDTQYTLPIITDSVEVTLLYQTLSKEYVEFLRDENVTNEAGNILYNFWDIHGKSSPEIMKKISAKTLLDIDADGITDSEDNCPGVSNPDQINDDGDEAGAVCDCNDTNPDIYPGAPARADGLDNDCDGIIDRVSQTIDFSIIPDQLANVGTINLNASSSSGLSISYILEQGNAQLLGNSLQINGSGHVSITANQGGNEGYEPADPVNQSFCINPLKPKIRYTFENNQALLISTSELDNQWYINGQDIAGAVNDTLFIKETGHYSVQVTTDQCFSEVSDEFFIEFTGISNYSTGKIISYPNPTDGLVTFKLPDQIQGSLLKISLLDLSGRYILSFVDLPRSTNETYIDLSYLEPGVYNYILLNMDSNRTFRGQIIIK